MSYRVEREKNSDDAENNTALASAVSNKFTTNRSNVVWASLRAKSVGLVYVSALSYKFIRRTD